MKYITIIACLVLGGCAGQTLLIPVTTQGRDKAGNATQGVRTIPIFRNTGNLANAKYSYVGPHGSVRFSADIIDNAVATRALHEGIQGDIHEAGSLIFKGMATGVTAGVLGGIPGAVVP